MGRSTAIDGRHIAVQRLIHVGEAFLDFFLAGGSRTPVISRVKLNF